MFESRDELGEFLEILGVEGLDLNSFGEEEGELLGLGDSGVGVLDDGRGFVLSGGGVTQRCWEKREAIVVLL